MRHNTKIRGSKDILIWAFALASITMPASVWSQPLPAENEWVVVIDAGHGGKDPGAVGAISKEKNINLAVALKAGKYISDNLRDVKVVYTRTDDTFPGLAERAEVANRNKADIFISIHSNAISDKRFTGTETYVLGQTMDEANLQVAMKENSVITFEQDYKTKYEGFDPNSAESYIIFSLMQNIYLKQSTEFATMIQNQFRDRVGRKDRGVRQAGFVVLWRTTMPSVLIELGFISNPEEEKYLNSAQGQDYLASAIYRAFRDYKQTIDSRSGLKPGGTQQVAENKEVGAVSTGNPATGGDGSQVNDNAGKPATVSNTRPVNDSTVRPASGSTGKPVNDSAAKPVPVFRSNDTTPVQAQDSVPVYNKPPPPVTAANDILFMVQVSAMPKNREMTPSQLKGLEPVTKIEDGERTKYAAGRFPVYDDALKYRRILTLRFPDAFVIAVRNGKIMPLREAIEAKK